MITDVARFVGSGSQSSDIFRPDILHEDLQLVSEETSARDRFRPSRLANNVREIRTVIRLVKFLEIVFLNTKVAKLR